MTASTQLPVLPSYAWPPPTCASRNAGCCPARGWPIADAAAGVGAPGPQAGQHRHAHCAERPAHTQLVCQGHGVGSQ
jgi:hypothetical protein